jgi:hypothetical protein
MDIASPSKTLPGAIASIAMETESPSKPIQKFALVRNSRKNGGADYQSEFSPERTARGKPKAKRVGRQKRPKTSG